MTDTAVFHLCARSAFDALAANEAYRADSLLQEGFIHLSRAHQVLPTARAYFANTPEVVVLVIDPTRLTSRLVFEAPAPLPIAEGGVMKPSSQDEYPHCYGPIDREAIVDVIDVAQFDGTPIHADTMAMLRQFRFARLPVEGTLYRSTWRSTRENANGDPVGTAMIGMYAESPTSVSCFHRLTHDEVWHAYAGDAFVLHLLFPDGRAESVRMGTNPLRAEHVQFVVPAGVWQAGHLAPGGRFALFGCTMAPGFTDSCFEAGDRGALRDQYPAMSTLIDRLTPGSGSLRMPPGFAT